MTTYLEQLKTALLHTFTNVFTIPANMFNPGDIFIEVVSPDIVLTSLHEYVLDWQYHINTICSDGTEIEPFVISALQTIEKYFDVGEGKRFLITGITVENLGLWYSVTMVFKVTQEVATPSLEEEF